MPIGIVPMLKVIDIEDHYENRGPVVTIFVEIQGEAVPRFGQRIDRGEFEHPQEEEVHDDLEE